MTVRSLEYDQATILRAIAKLHCGGGFDADVTYGNGVFYEQCPELQPIYKFDVAPQVSRAALASSTCLPVAGSSFRSVVFDPPFLTYVKASRAGGRESNFAMAKRYSGYWRYDELEDHYRRTLIEVNRVLEDGGVMVFKCQDIIHNHMMFCTHANVIEWARAAGFRLLDLFVLAAKSRMPMPDREAKQKHARVYHCYFLVLKKVRSLPDETHLENRIAEMQSLFSERRPA